MFRDEQQIDAEIQTEHPLEERQETDQQHDGGTKLGNQCADPNRLARPAESAA